MQIGDMVQLSKAGLKNRQNGSVKGKIGLIIEIDVSSYPYIVQWYGVENPLPTVHGVQNVLPCKRYELKKLMVEK